MDAHATACMYGAEDNLRKSLLSFYHVGSGDQTRLVLMSHTREAEREGESKPKLVYINETLSPKTKQKNLTELSLPCWSAVSVEVERGMEPESEFKYCIKSEL